MVPAPRPLGASPSARTVDPEKIGVPFGRYLLGQRLATGGMGEVFLAVQMGLGKFQKPLALKLLLPHLTERAGAVQRFLDEAQLAARMNHPNVVQIFDVGVIEGRYYLAMELVRGVSMSSMIHALAERGERLPAQVFLYIARALCEALHHAHEQRGPDGDLLHIVHRDVSPQNVLLSVDGEVKLTDFGIAQGGDATQPSAGRVLGKVQYMAPEQARGEPVDRRADLFGAAVTLFHLATLRSPFARATPQQTLEALLHEPLPDLTEARPDLPLGLVRACEKGAAKAPDARFPTARAMRDALPMPERADIAEVLGGLVRSGCKDALLELEEKTCQVLELRAHTASVSISPADVTQAGEWKQERGLARRWAKVVGAAVGLGAMALLLALGLPRQEAAPRVPPPVSPGRASPSVSPASAKLAALAPVAPAPESPVRSPPVAPSSGLRARTTPRSPAEPTRPKGGLGYLTVDAVPWAVVFVDGKRLGETPLARRKVPAGDLTLTFVNADLKRTVKREVTVRAGQHATIREDLR